uniref:Uncharacterized protein n=1 Tax=Erpetoichthys calabaricus TaxID=27687 RepID=A0A8C4T6J5_ERPCA
SKIQCPVTAIRLAQLFLSQDDITCLLCLNTLTDPVTIPCGHSFCLECLTDCWDQSQECSCPQCKEIFTTKPVLRKTTVLNEIIKKSKVMGLTSSPPSQNNDGPRDMECDFCNGKKVRVVKSCLTCMASFCDTQMQPHHEGAAWKGLKLVDLDGNLQEKLCAKHQKILEIFCKTDNSCICMMCVVTGHNVFQMSSLIFFCLSSDFCSLTLDINTAHRRLRLSEGNKKVTCERTVTDYPDHTDRFDRYVQVLCREALTGTRCYWEVKCTGHCVVIGVAYTGLGRKGEGVECCLGDNDKSWCLLCSHSKYSVRHNDKWIVINAPYSPRIGVYLDWPAGSLSFYSVSHTMTLLHSFNTPFTEPLYPGFGLNYNVVLSLDILHPSIGHTGAQSLLNELTVIVQR